MFGTCIFLIAALLAIIYFLVNHRHEYWKRKGVPQLEPIDFIFGNYRPILKSEIPFQTYFLDVYRKLKARGVSYFGIYLTWFPEFVPVKLDLIKRIMVTDFAYFGAHGFYHSKNDLLTHHLFNLEGQVWKDRRTRVTPFFTSGKMKMMFEIVSSKADELSKVIEGFAQTGEPIKIQEVFANYTMDVITTAAFGLDIDALHNAKSEFREVAKHALANNTLGTLMRAFVPFNVLDMMGHKTRPKHVRDYFSQVVLDTIRYRETNKVERNDFMQMMINLKNYGTLDRGSSKTHEKVHWTTEEIISESFLMFSAGFETSSSAMTCALAELALPQNRHVQDKLREEIHETVAKSDGKLTYEGIINMEYLEKVLKETLRKYPVLAMIPRTCTKDYTVPGTNIVIKKGTRIHIPALGIQMDEEYYPNPEQFNPENFSKENVASRPDFTWLTFGEGPRQCLGLRFGKLQAKMGVAALLLKYRFSYMDESNITYPFPMGFNSQAFTFKQPAMLLAKRI